jgi:hypothetical protein
MAGIFNHFNPWQQVHYFEIPGDDENLSNLWGGLKLVEYVCQESSRPIRPIDAVEGV